MPSKVKYPLPSDQVTMIGLDFGSTTSSAMVATARVGLSCTTGRMEFGVPRVVYRSESIFTPFHQGRIDSARLESSIDQWLDESGIGHQEIFAGGVIITGLAARQANAAELARLIGERIGEAVVATADDPCLESWLAFMGSCAVLSRSHTGVPFINIDIGGGTTNPAFGVNGSVLHTGCHFIGARHFQFEPGSYHLTDISPYGLALLEDFGIDRRIGQDLAPMQIERILSFYITALEAVVEGDTDFFNSPIAKLHQQVPFAFESMRTPPILVYSGGVGELIYRQSQGKELPGTTYYGDLGIDLAKRIVQSPRLAAHLNDMIPENQGRATVYGLALHSTEISGSTIFLSSDNMLPRQDLPIVARLRIDSDGAQLLKALVLVDGSSNGACIQVLPGASEAGALSEDAGIPVYTSLDAVKSFALRLRNACKEVKPRQPVVILVPHNYGQVLGNYASNWRQQPFDLIVIDEIPDRQAHFVNIGRLHNKIVPASFYGIC